VVLRQHDAQAVVERVFFDRDVHAVVGCVLGFGRCFYGNGLRQLLVWACPFAALRVGLRAG
jgi:hypothetical protein